MGYFHYIEKMGKVFIQNRLEKRFRQYVFFMETSAKMYSIVLGPYFGNFLYQYMNNDFKKASLILSGSGMFFAFLFLILFVIPEICNLQKFKIQEPLNIPQNESEKKHLINSVKNTAQEIAPLKKIIDKFNKIKNIKSQTKYLSNSNKQMYLIIV